ncbi:MAG: type II secretion system protein, partial [Tenericutes bacterium]|nr:type II secretion system protein [Mycoplasmatota bacterium]
MFNKNGYTLVEVLAVLILLAIIFTIAAPRMLDSIDESKKSAFKVSANTIMDQLQKSYAKGEIEVPSSGKLFVIENNAFVGDSINVRGTLPDSGSIHLSENGEIAFSLYKEDYCAVKDIGQDTITVSNNFAACIINIPQPVSQDCFSR